MIDSHCHLDHEPLFDNLESVIQRSKDVGITKLLTISTSSLKALEIFNLKESDINLSSISNHIYLKEGNKINKVGILFKKIEKEND